MTSALERTASLRKLSGLLQRLEAESGDPFAWELVDDSREGLRAVTNLAAAYFPRISQELFQELIFAVMDLHLLAFERGEGAA